MQLTMFEPASESQTALSFGRASPTSSATKGTPSDAFLARLLGKTASCSLQGKKWQDAGCVYGPKRTIACGSWTPNISAWPNETFLVVPPIGASYGRLQGCSHQDANQGHSHLVYEDSTIRRLTPR